MLSYAVQRLSESFLVLLIVSFASYGLIGLMPGDPIDLMFSADPDVTAADLERLRAIHGLDHPLWQRYLAWLSNALQGDFGYSRLYQKPVTEIMLSRMGATLQLLGVSTVFAIILSIPLGIFAAARKNTFLDYIINSACFAGISVPPFWLALLLIAYIAVPVSWVPASGMASPGSDISQILAHMMLPVLALTVTTVGGFTRFMRGAALQVLNQDYIRTAQAKGVSPMRCLFDHVLRNAVLPLVTVIALGFGSLFSGALITETLFGWNGMGRTIYTAIMGNDFNLALVGLMVATAFTLIANIIADIFYTFLDPRIRLQDSETGA